MTENKIISHIDFTKSIFDDYYVECQFHVCDFSDLEICKVDFENCIFKECNFSNSKFLNHQSDIRFVNCKLLGADFSGATKFTTGLNFEGSNLSYASFSGVKLKNANFKDSILLECDFSDSDLTGVVFDKCDLSRTVFAHTNLEKTDFSHSDNMVIDPNVNRLKKTVFQESQLHALVAHLDIIIT